MCLRICLCILTLLYITGDVLITVRDNLHRVDVMFEKFEVVYRETAPTCKISLIFFPELKLSEQLRGSQS